MLYMEPYMSTLLVTGITIGLLITVSAIPRRSWRRWTTVLLILTSSSITIWLHFGWDAYNFIVANRLSLLAGLIGLLTLAMYIKTIPYRTRRRDEARARKEERRRIRQEEESRRAREAELSEQEERDARERREHEDTIQDAYRREFELQTALEELHEYELPARLYTPPFTSDQHTLSDIEHELRLMPKHDGFSKTEVAIRALNPALPLPLQLFAYYRQVFRDHYIKCLFAGTKKKTLRQSLTKLCALFKEDATAIRAEAEDIYARERRETEETLAQDRRAKEELEEANMDKERRQREQEAKERRQEEYVKQRDEQRTAFTNMLRERGEGGERLQQEVNHRMTLWEEDNPGPE